MWAVVDRAVELADAENARLTLAKTTCPGRVATCLSPMAALVFVLPVSDEQLESEAGRRLALAAERVPAHIPLTTVLSRNAFQPRPAAQA